MFIIWLLTACGVSVGSLDTGDTGLRVAPQPGGTVSTSAALTCPEPGDCGCEWLGYDLDAQPGDETCVHVGASVDPSVVLDVGATVHDRAVVAAGVRLGANSTVGVAAIIGEDAVVDAGTIVGRRAQIGARSVLGPDSTLGRSAVVGEDVQAATGRLSMGYAAELGDRVQVLGTGVVLGNQVTVADDAVIGANVTIARNTSVGAGASLGAGTILGPEVSVGADAELGASVRVRKNVTLGAGTEVGDGSRIGRDSELGPGVTVGTNATLRSDVFVGGFNTLANNTYVPRGTHYEPIDPDRDAPPTVSITAPTAGADVSGGAVLVEGVASDDIGIASLQVRLDSGAPIDLPLANGQFSSVITVPAGTTSVRVVATDTGGQVAADTVFVSDCSVATSFNTQWTGAVSSDWSDASNWSNGVPGATSRAFVCGSLEPQPRLSASTALRELSMSGDAVVDIAAHELTLDRTLAGGTVSGSGTVHFIGSGTARGIVPHLAIDGSTNLSGYLEVTRTATINGGGRLLVANHELQVRDDFVQHLSATNQGLQLNGTGFAQIHDDATFNGSAAMGLSLTQGELRIAGNLTIANTSTPIFLPSGSPVVFNGNANQYVYAPSSSATGPRFVDLIVRKPAGGTLYFASGNPLFTDGDVYVEDGSELTAYQATVSGDIHLRGDADFTTNTTLLLHGEVIPNDDSYFWANELAVTSVLPRRGGTTFYANTLRIADRIVQSEDWAELFDDVVIGPGGSLDVRTATVSFSDDLTHDIQTATTDGLRLNDGAHVIVNGEASFTGTVAMPYYHLYTGTLTVLGGLKVQNTSTAVFLPYNTVVELGGNANRYIDFPSASLSGSHFGDLRITNTAGAVRFNAPDDLVVDGDLTVVGGAQLQGDNLSVTGAITLEDSGRINATTLSWTGELHADSASYLYGDRFEVSEELPDSAGYQYANVLAVVDDIQLTQSYSRSLNTLSLEPGATLQVRDNTLDIGSGDFIQNLGVAGDGLSMSSTSVVRIGGDATFNGTVAMSPGLLNYGEIYVGGNLRAQNTSRSVLYPGGTRFIFDGSGNQTVNLGNAAYSYLRDVTVRSGSRATFTADTGSPFRVRDLTVETQVNTSVDVRVDRDLTVQSGASVNHPGFDFYVDGSCAGVVGSVNPGTTGCN